MDQTTYMYYWFANDSSPFPDDCMGGGLSGPHPLKSPKKVVTIVLAIVGVLINIVGLNSLIQQSKRKKDRSIRSRIILLISLSLSDIAICVFVPLNSYVEYAMEGNIMCNSPAVYHCTKTFLDAVVPSCTMLSLLNLLGMAVDHWLTFTKPFQYVVMMSRRRTLIMVACFWIFAVIMAFSEYISGLAHISDPDSAGLHFCEAIKMNRVYSVNYVMLALAPVCLFAMVIIYCSIFSEIKQLVVAPPRQQDFGQARRALYTTLVILVSFLICWLPCYTTTATFTLYAYLYRQGKVSLMDEESLMLLLHLQQWFFALLVTNSILDPLIYMSNLRMKLHKFCQVLACKIRHPYGIVQTADCHREDVQTTPTITTVRSSIQMSSPCNLPSMEPLNSASNAC